MLISSQMPSLQKLVLVLRCLSMQLRVEKRENLWLGNQVNGVIRQGSCSPSPHISLLFSLLSPFDHLTLIPTFHVQSMNGHGDSFFDLRFFIYRTKRRPLDLAIAIFTHARPKT